MGKWTGRCRKRSWEHNSAGCCEDQSGEEGMNKSVFGAGKGEGIAVGK